MSARGLKRLCGECSTLFYDLNKSPIICPSCGAEYSGLVKVKTRKSKSVNDDAPTKENDTTTDEDGEIEASEGISLQDLEEGDDNSDDDDENQLDDADLDLDNLDDLDDVDADDDDLDEDIAISVDDDDR